jgi:hypothetical protein
MTGMVRIEISEAAFTAIASTLPEGAAALAVKRTGGKCFLHLDERVANGLMAMRGPSESYSDVILRLVELETSG